MRIKEGMVVKLKALKSEGYVDWYHKAVNMNLLAIIGKIKESDIIIQITKQQKKSIGKKYGHNLIRAYKQEVEGVSLYKEKG